MTKRVRAKIYIRDRRAQECDVKRKSAESVSLYGKNNFVERAKNLANCKYISENISVIDHQNNYRITVEA